VTLYEYHQMPDLDSPVLVVVMDGWIDAGLGAGAALETIIGSRSAELVATFDADSLLDHRARRPTMHLVDGIQTGLSWPTIELRATADADDNDVLVLLGAEPDHAWRAFSDAVVTLAMSMGARMIVGLGAYPAPVPHTRPTRVVSTTGSRELADRAGFVQGRVDVPAGVQAAIEEHAHSLGVPSLGLWAQVPHYASAMPYPAAGAALLDALPLVAGIRFDSAGLRDDAVAARSRLDELIADSSEHQQLVQQLEQQTDAATGPIGQPGGEPLPSGDELVAELERFLRDQDNS
jgi:predicted ATP-grasp superfamily ATP-dependent carboligase